MSKTISKDIYDITYNITDGNLTIGIENTETFKKYSSLKTSEEYKVYSDIGIDIFDIIDKSFIKGSFNIGDNGTNIIITFINGQMKIPIQCERIMGDHTEEADSEIKFVLKNMKKKMDNYEKQILKLTKQVEEQQKYIDFNDKYVFIHQHRINKYKKHLIVASCIYMPMVNTFELCGSFNHLKYGDKNIDAMHIYLSQKEFTRLYRNKQPQPDFNHQLFEGSNIWRRSVGDCTGQLTAFNIHNDLTLRDNYNINIPYFLASQRYIDIEEVLQMRCDILTLAANVEIINFDLLRNFKGTQLHIINCTIPDISEEDFLSCIETLTNLTTLAIYFNTGLFPKIKFRRSFFKNLKSLKTFVTHGASATTPTLDHVDCDQKHISIFKI
jgi:hypothetical protein